MALGYLKSTLEVRLTHTLFTLALILAVVLCPDVAHSQANAKEAALREKAFKLLESAAGQVTNLQSPENRARLGANIADSLWNHDEKRARAVFALVEEDIRAGMANRNLKDPKDQHTLKVFLKLRVDTVERIAGHDAELALAFLKATQFTSEEPLPRELTESESGFEIRLAIQIANSNPEQALKFARQSLKEGFSEQLLELLRRVNRKDKVRGLTLYREIVKKLREVNFVNDWNIRYFVTNLVDTFKPSDDSAFRELIGVLITSALDHGCGTNSLGGFEAEHCRWVASIRPQLETIDSRAAQLERWVRQRSNADVAPELVHEFYDQLVDGTVDDQLAFAAKHPSVAGEIYPYLIRKAAEANDLALARKLVTDQISDPEKKRELLLQIDGFEEASSYDDKKVEEIQSHLNELPTNAARVQLLLDYVHTRVSNNPNTLLKVLKQASDIADAMKPGKEQTDAHLKLALIYCLEKNDRGFAIMESLVPKLNDLVEAAVKLDGFETSYLRDGEWNMSANGNLGEMLTMLSRYAGYFAWYDFDRAAGLAAQFDRSEIRLMAQVKLAQSILAGPPKRMRTYRHYVFGR